MIRGFLPGSGSRILVCSIPDPGSASKNFNPKKWFLSTQKYDPGFSSRIRILIFHPSPIPGSKRQRIPDPGSATLVCLTPSPSLYLGGVDVGGQDVAHPVGTSHVLPVHEEADIVRLLVVHPPEVLPVHGGRDGVPRVYFALHGSESGAPRDVLACPDPCNRRKIRLIEGNAKCRHQKGLCGRCLSARGPEPHTPPLTH
jgi:hypothetical protein